MPQCIDRTIFYFINHALSNPFFDFIMPVLSAIGDGPLLFTASFILLFSKKRELKILGLILLSGITINYYIVSGLKTLVARPRPFLVLPDVFLLAVEKSMSFPSNHAATAFMAATALTAYFKKYTAIFYLFALAIAVSRVYVGVHYPSDITAGAAIGIVTGYLLVRVGYRI
jgi:undecaprenyl-diphosphatase